MTRLANRVLVTLVYVIGFTLLTESGGVIIRTDGYTGIIFPAERRAFGLDLYEKGLDYWTPSEADVQTAEREIPRFLQVTGTKDPQASEILNKLKIYKRQYAGIVSKGEKQIFINFFCFDPPVDPPEDRWTKNEVIVNDGGSCFFNVRFSMKTKTFSELMINGRA